MREDVASTKAERGCGRGCGGVGEAREEDGDEREARRDSEEAWACQSRSREESAEERQRGGELVQDDCIGGAEGV